MKAHRLRRWHNIKTAVGQTSHGVCFQQNNFKVENGPTNQNDVLVNCILISYTFYQIQ